MQIGTGHRALRPPLCSRSALRSRFLIGPERQEQAVLPI
jgi:hypothetical protein